MTQDFVRLSQEKITQILPIREKDSYKGNYGRVLLIGGNVCMGGAIQMAATACIESGAGLVSVATDPTNFPAIHANLPEAMVCDWQDRESLKSLVTSNEIILIGPGMGQGTFDFDTFMSLIEKNTPNEKILIFDADGLKALSDHLHASIWTSHQVIVTPHPGEWKNLNPNNLSPEEWVDQTGFHLVLKSDQTKIYSGDKDSAYINTVGNPGMATGGMGDTLAGMVAGLAGQIESVEASLCASVYLHSYIGDQLFKDRHVVRPTQLASQISPTIKKFLKNKTHLKKI